MDLDGLCIMQLAIRLVYTRPIHTQGRRGTGGRPSKPIFLNIFRPRTGLAIKFLRPLAQIADNFLRNSFTFTLTSAIFNFIIPVAD